MTRSVIAYIATALVFLALDAVWLSQMSGRLYKPALGDLALDGFRLGPAAAFYLIYVLGVVVMAIAPGLREADWQRAALNGALLGFFAYSTYDLTNQATLKHWSTTLTVVDIAWGTFASCVAATAGYAAAAFFSKA